MDYFLKVEQRLGKMQKKASQKIDSNFQKLGALRKIVGKIEREMERCVKVYFLC